MPYLVGSSEQLSKLVADVKGREPYIILISGASGSGKTTEAERLVKHLDERGVSLIRYRGKPVYIELDMFYRDEATKQSNLLGENYDHPVEIDVNHINSILDDIIEGKEVYLPVYSFKESRRIGRIGPIVPDENPVIVVEGLYAIGLLSHRSNLNVYVEARSKMELIARRLIRDVERTGRKREVIVDQALTAMSMWNIYGEPQKYMADVVLRSRYNILEDRGVPSYQVKIPADKFEKEMPSTARELFSSKSLRVEDLVIGDIEERMRGRLVFDGIFPSSFELSYRTLVPSGIPFVKSLKVALGPQAYTAFVKLSQIMGYRPHVYYREIYALEKDGIVFKWYPEKDLVEIETGNETTIMKYVERFRGTIRFRSYYSKDY